MTYDPQNIFAKILRREIPCKQVYEDEQVLAFHDIHPKAPLHILVIPKSSYMDFHDFHTNAPNELVGHFYKMVSEIAINLGLTAEDKGHRIIVNCGPHGGQEVPHYHAHILGGCPLGPMISLPHETNL